MGVRGRTSISEENEGRGCTSRKKKKKIRNLGVHLEAKASGQMGPGL